MLVPLLILAAGALLAAAGRKPGSSAPTEPDKLSGAPQLKPELSQAELASLYKQYSTTARAGELEPTSITGTLELALSSCQGLPEPTRTEGLNLTAALETALQHGQDPGKVKRALVRLIGESACLGLAGLGPSSFKKAVRGKRELESLLRDVSRDKLALIDWLLAQYVGDANVFGGCDLIAAHGLLGLFEAAFSLPGESEVFDGLGVDEHYSRWKVSGLKSKRAKYNQWLREKINRWARESNVTIPHRERTCPALEYLGKVRSEYLTGDNAPSLVGHLLPLLRVVLRDKMVPWSGGESELSCCVPLVR